DLRCQSVFLAVRVFFFFSSRRRHTRLVSDWSSDVCSSDLSGGDGRGGQQPLQARFTLEPGTYRVQVRYSTGVIRARDITVGESRSEERRVGKEGRARGGWE